MPFSYPLDWPATYPRTSVRRRALFGKDWTIDRARRFVAEELRRLGARSWSASTNLELRLDGEPRGRQTISDPAVAVWFETSAGSRVLACDRWDRVEHNLVAVGKTIEALRGCDRWGAADLERTFTGYAALPPAGGGVCDPWTELGLAPGASEEQVRAAFRRRAKELHPDTGGNGAAFVALVEARNDVLRRIGATP